MYILQCSVILFLLGIFRGTYETICSTGHNWEVAELCQTTQSTENTVILDGYVVHNNDSLEKKCKCTAIVSIPSNGSSKIVFNNIFDLQPGYNGCGSHISIQGSVQSVIQRCYISGSMAVKNQEHLEIELVKDHPREDTRYCMKINIKDSSASLKVTCYSQTATIPSQSTLTSPAITSTSSELITLSTHTTTQSDGITTSSATVGDSTATRDAPTTKLATPITQQTSKTGSSSQSITMTSIPNSTTTPTTKDPSSGGTSSDKDLPESDQALYIAIGVGCGGVIIAIVVLVILIKRKTCSSSSTRAYECPRVHEYSNEHFYDSLNDNTVSIATQEHNLTNENYINLDLRS